MDMNLAFWMMFLAVTFLFASVLGFLIKWTAGRYIPSLLAIPVKGWILILMAFAILAQLAGLPIAEGYAAFFKWVSSTLGGGI